MENRMVTKMEQRPTQFPASFPDTFKDFFSMVNEEEDHIELFSNLLEDKVIPRTNKCRYRGSRTRNSANSSNVGRSNSFRLMRTGSDYCKHMRYCCLHQNHLINSHNELEYINISDDEKQMKKIGLLKEVSHEKGCNCEHCEETDTISTCSSNNTTSYSCLLRHNKSLRSRGNLTRNTGNTISTSPLLCPEQNQMSTSSSPSTVPSDFTKTINDNNNICSCKSPADIQQIKSPMINRRRASSIAAAHLSTEQRLLKVDDQYSRSGNTFTEPHSRFSHSKSPLNVCPSAFAKQIDGTNNVPTKQKQRMRTSSMPAENRKPRLADTRRAAIHCADMDLEYYRLRSFSITSHGICNLGDSMRSRRSRSINSVTSTATSHSGKDRNNSNASQISAERIKETDVNEPITAYKIAMLGDAGVGKTALTYQFTTSDYICAYDLSLDDDYGQKTVSVLLDGQETDLEIIDHPACEMSTEAFCSTYNVDLFVVVYSVVDRKSFKTAEQILHYLKDGEMLLTRGAILVGNKIDLERHREVPRQAARRTAKEVACKFIETSSGIDHNVNELLVGIVAQVKLNPLRINNLTEKQRLSLNTTNTLHRHRKLTVNERPLQRMPKPHNIQKRETEERNSDNKNNQIETNFNDHFRKLKQNDDCNDHDDDDRRYNNNPNYQDNRNDNVDDEAVDKEVSLINKINEPSCSLPNKCDSYDSQQRHTPKPTNLLDEKTVSKMSNRTKLFLTSFLKFKRTLRVKRRNSNSCSDLFVI